MPEPTRSPTSSALAQLSMPRVASQAAAEYIRLQIFHGHYPPNTRVPQDQVAVDLNISRIPIREALVTLDSEGYVVLEANRGAVVTAFHAEDLRSFFKMRGFSLALAAQRCARQADPVVIHTLNEVWERMYASTSADEFATHSEQFNRHITEFGGSPRLRAAIARYRNIVPGNFFAEVPGTREVESESAKRISVAIADQDVDGVLACYLDRGREHAERLINLLAERGQLADD
ncbi:MAG TPA: GntR family transcriptional regulator [Pseudonocardiaceae bacterium]|nr:GntR family transcriptional regulator [Pseudonocardiaceae bacterium]